MRLLAVNQLVSFIGKTASSGCFGSISSAVGYFLIDIASKNALPLYRPHAELEAMADGEQVAI